VDVLWPWLAFCMIRALSRRGGLPRHLLTKFVARAILMTPLGPCPMPCPASTRLCLARSGAVFAPAFSCFGVVCVWSAVFGAAGWHEEGTAWRAWFRRWDQWGC